MAEALQSLHAAGVAHRDLKPSNVPLTADVFALGVLAYFAVTGRLAFGGGHSHAVTYRILEQEPDLAGCPEPLRSIVAACLDKRPEHRPTPAEIVQRCQGNAALRPPTRRRLLLAAAGLTGAAAPGVAVPLLWPDDEPRPRTAPRGTPADDGGSRRTADLPGHAQGVASLSFSPDGSLVASASDDDVVGVWDVATGDQLADLTGHTQEVWSVAFNADGPLASASRDGTVRLWDAESGRQRTVLTHDDGLSGLAFSPDGTLLATGNWTDRTVILWDVPTGERRETLTVPVDGLEGRGNTEDVAFSADGSTLATANSDGTVTLWTRS